jgi:hypothetical protein
MTTLREAAQQALETLEALSRAENIIWVQKRAEIEVAHLRAALAQEEQEPCTYRCEAWPECVCADLAKPAQEPVAWRWKAMVNGDFVSNWVLTHSEPPPYALESQPLYTAPPRMIVSPECAERGCAAHDHRVDGPGMEIPRREWKGLSEDEADKLVTAAGDHSQLIHLVWEIDALLKERNHG